MKRTPLFCALFAMTAASLAAVGFAAEPTRTSKKAKDPNEKICETQEVLGSRLATRRVCATRAEWEERRQRERDMVDRTQSQRCTINPATGLCG